MARRPPMAVTSVTIGAPAPRDLAAFYAQLLGWTVTASEPARPGMSPEDGWAQLRPAGSRRDGHCGGSGAVGATGAVLRSGRASYSRGELKPSLTSD